MKKSTKVLITGSLGLLGIGLIEEAPPDINIISTYCRNNKIKKIQKIRLVKLDITKKEEINKTFSKYRPQVVIHAASAGNVDYCEKNKKIAYEVNVLGTKNIISACKKIGSRLIFLSSNAVFDGQSAPYKETSKVNPINYYGKTKVLGEELVKKSKLDYLIIRLILMYGWNDPNERKNPVTWLLNKLRNNQPVFMVNDTYTNPILNIQAASIIWKLIKKNSIGIYHLAGKESINRYEFALKIAKVFKLNKKLIKPVNSSYFKGIAKRMPNTTYDTSKMQKQLLVKPMNIEEGLTYLKNHPLVVNQ